MVKYTICLTNTRMNNIKNTITKNFTIVPNELINNFYLSDRSRFLFVFLACKSDSWEFYNKNLANSLGYSIESLRKYMKDLAHSGWIIQIRQKRKNGKFGGNEFVLNSAPLQISPYWEKHVSEINRVRKNLTHSNTNYYKKEKKKKKDSFLKRDANSTIHGEKSKKVRGPLK